jgi:NADH-quinone oxidoreductase subunit J
MGGLFFFLIAGLLIGSAIGVVSFRNPINSALCLVVNLIGVAVMFASLDAHFLSAVQIIVYAGAIVVLVLFVLMLLNVKYEQIQTPSYFLVGAASLLAMVFLWAALPLVHGEFAAAFPEMAAQPTGQVEVGSVKSIGLRLYSKYVFLFESASILIMGAIAGAVMLAKKKYR